MCPGAEECGGLARSGCPRNAHHGCAAGYQASLGAVLGWVDDSSQLQALSCGIAFGRISTLLISRPNQTCHM